MKPAPKFTCTDCGKEKNRKKHRVGWSEPDKTQPSGWIHLPFICVDCWEFRDEILRSERNEKTRRQPAPVVREVDADSREVELAARALEQPQPFRRPS